MSILFRRLYTARCNAKDSVNIRERVNGRPGVKDLWGNRTGRVIYKIRKERV